MSTVMMGKAGKYSKSFLFNLQIYPHLEGLHFFPAFQLCTPGRPCHAHHSPCRPSQTAGYGLSSR